MIPAMVKIESDGAGIGSRVLNDRGEEIHGVTSASWKCDAGGVATAYLTISPAAIDAKALKVMFNSAEKRAGHAMAELIGERVSAWTAEGVMGAKCEGYNDGMIKLDGAWYNVSHFWKIEAHA